MNRNLYLLKLLPLLFLLVAPALARAQFLCTTNPDNTITIAGYTGSDANLIIPDTITGLPVVEIGDQAFDGDFSLTSVTIPDSVLSIDHAAFASCNALTTITMGNGVTNIGISAFIFCNGLTNIVIPDSVKTIGDYVFMDCYNLTNVMLGSNVDSIGADAFYGSIGLWTINVSSNNSVYSSTDGVLFNKDQTTLIAYPGGVTSRYIIPTGVKTIGTNAFITDTLTNVIISVDVTTIDEYAFDFCTNLMSVTICGRVTNLGAGIFQECSALNSVAISNGICNVGNAMFIDCYSLPNITLPDSVTAIGTDAFYGCSGLTNVMIPDTITNIADGAFNGCGALAQITLPSSLNNIGEDAFGDCRALTNIIIPNRVTNIGYGAFQNCLSLAAVYFEGGPPNGSSAFFPENITAYYLPGTSGWDTTYNGLPTAPWYLPYPSILNSEPTFGIQTNAFSFTISWATNAAVAVDACTNLSNPLWQPVQTNTLTAGTVYFNDPQWTNYPTRFYRVRSL